MFTVIAENASMIVMDVLSELCREPTDFGSESVKPEWDAVGPRGLGTRELRNTWYRLEDVTKCATWLPGRNLNYPFMVAEWLWIYLGRDDLEMIKYYNANIAKFSDDGEKFYGAYGPRWRGQIGGCIERLRKDPDSRQAVLALWRESYNRVSNLGGYMSTKDVPCTLVMQYMIRRGKLEASVCMRSSDTWLGLPYDLFNFAMLQRCVAAELQLQPGPLTLAIGSSHLYDSNLDAAKALVERWNDPHANVPDTCRLIMPPAPRVYAMWNIMERETQLRMLNDIEEHPCDIAWMPWLSMLAYREHRSHELVDPTLQPLVQS